MADAPALASGASPTEAPDGTVAGTGAVGYNGDNIQATSATLYTPHSVAVDRRGDIYISDTTNNRVRRVRATDGRITTYAGNGGQNGFNPDGPATVTYTMQPTGLALDAAGNLYFAETQLARVRRVGTNGMVTTVVGSKTNLSLGFAGDDGQPNNALMRSPTGVAVGPGGTLFIGDTGNHRVRRVRSPFSEFLDIGLSIASEDGTEVYEFDRFGRHRQTLDATTGVGLATFTYTPAGTLASVTDKNGLVTRVERDAAGAATAVIAPHGQRTELAIGADGYVTRLADGTGAAFAFEYAGTSATTAGLLAALTDARGGVARFTYDALGRLVRDEDAAGGFVALARSGSGATKTVAVTTAEGRIARYGVTQPPVGDEARSVEAPDGTTTAWTRGNDGTVAATFANGTTARVTVGPDPRFKMQSPVPSGTITTPGGRALTIAAARTATGVEPGNPLSFVSVAETLALNGRTYASNYVAATRTLTETTPAARAFVS
ncbi:MAG: hypothetical protein AAB295_12070, partial [Chloroflexota bacterium]